MYLKGGLTLCCVVLCAYSSWIWRNAKNPIYRYAPVAFFFPLWLYSQVYNSIASWPLYFLFAMILTKTESGSRLHRLMVGYIMLSAMSVMFPIAWELCVKLKVLNPSGIGWVFHAVQNFINMVLFLLGAWMLLKGPQIVEKEPEHV
jgi:hypothetical protein